MQKPFFIVKYLSSVGTGTLLKGTLKPIVKVARVFFSQLIRDHYRIGQNQFAKPAARSLFHCVFMGWTKLFVENIS
jgi:hypothetical protein